MIETQEQQEHSAAPENHGCWWLLGNQACKYNEGVNDVIVTRQQLELSSELVKVFIESRVAVERLRHFFNYSNEGSGVGGT